MNSTPNVASPGNLFEPVFGHVSDEMNRTLVVTPQAEAEIDQATNWYDGQSLRAAARFREAVDHALETISRNPEQYQDVYGNAQGL